MVSRDGFGEAWKQVRLGMGSTRVAGVVRDVRNRFGNARRDCRNTMQRATRNGMSDYDIFDFGPTVMHRFPDWLRRYARMTIGYPSGYEDEPDKWLVKHDDDWWDEPCSVSIMFHDSFSPRVKNPVREHFGKAWDALRGVDGDDASEGNGKRRGDGLLTSRTNREVGIGYVAWLTDIEYAADIIEEYNRWDDIMYSSGQRQLYGSEEANRMHGECERKFREAWRWIGENIMGMWV